MLTFSPSLPRRVPRSETQSPAGALSLPHNFLWTLAGNITYMGCQWGMLVVLAKLGSPEMLGRFALAFALTAPVFQFSGLQLRGLQATDARSQYLFGEYLGLRLITVCLSLVAVAGICLAVGYRSEVLLIALLVAAAKGFEAVSDVYYGRMQLAERMDGIAKSMIWKGGVSLAALASTIAVTGSLAWGVTMLAASWLAMLIFYDVPRARQVTVPANPAELRPRFPAQRLQSLAVRALPLGFVMLLLSLQANIPRYVLERQLGEGALGIFAALAALMVAGNAVVNALGQSALPRLAVFAAGDQKREFGRLAGRLLAVAAGLGMIGMGVSWVAGRQFLALVYSTEYAAHANTFRWLMAAAAASYFWSFLGVTLTALQEFRLQMFLQAATAALCAILSIVLVQRFGLPGAGFAVFGTMLFGMASYAIVLGRWFGLHR